MGRKHLPDDLLALKYKKETFHIKAKYIAEPRADYFATVVDGYEKGSEEWQKEFEHSLNEFDLRDWYYNSMDFAEIKHLTEEYQEQQRRWKMATKETNNLRKEVTEGFKEMEKSVKETLKEAEKKPEAVPVRTDYDVDNIYKYHAPKGDQPKRYEALRAKAKELAVLIIKLCPESPERTLALRDIERGVMMANASISRNE